jgi:hypothetical protein
MIKGRSTSAVFQDAIKGANAVSPIDFLALRIGASVIGDAHLIDPYIQAGDLRRDFGFKTEPVFLYR